MKLFVAFFSGFLLFASLMCVMWWLSGYNFDHRSADVASGYALTLFVSTMGGFLACLFVNDC